MKKNTKNRSRFRWCLWHGLAALTLAFTFSACEYYTSIEMENHSVNDIMVYMSYGYEPHMPTHYPDTLLPEDKWCYPDKKISDCMPIVKARSKNTLLSTVSNDDSGVEGLIDSISVFVIIRDAVEKHGYEGVREKKMVSIRYDLSGKDIKSLDGILHYPPNPLMKDMKMSPTYEVFYQEYNEGKEAEQ